MKELCGINVVFAFSKKVLFFLFSLLQQSESEVHPFFFLINHAFCLT
jgi:hypothetical protein